jgi:hypothetical protein
MSAPRHLWSGDWRLDSAAAAEELARRRAEAEKPPEKPEAERPQDGPNATARAAVRLRDGYARKREDSARQREESARRREESARMPEEAVRRREEPVRRRDEPVRRREHDDRAMLRRHRTSLLAVLGSLLVAAVAFAAVSLVAGSGGKGSQNGGGPPAYLGVEMANNPVNFPGSGSGFPFANGVMVDNVLPGSPAAAAGIVPGDVITSIDNHPVTTAAQVNGEIARLHAGDRVQIQYVQSFTTYTAQATLTRPPGSP